MRALAALAAFAIASCAMTFAHAQALDTEQRSESRLGRESPLRFFTGFQIRRFAIANPLGQKSPTDGVLGSLPEALAAVRVGAELYDLTGYVVGGGGAYRVYRMNITEGEVPLALTDTFWSGFYFGGVGAEVRLHPRISFGAEVTMGRTTARAGNLAIVTPDHQRTMRSVIAGLRITY